MKQWLVVVILLLMAYPSSAQFSRYRVQLKDKAAATHQLSTPSDYLAVRAIQRRARFQIAIDSSDLPIPDSYIHQIRAIPGLTVLNQSKWLNAVSVQTSDPAAISALSALPFVASIQGMAARPVAGKGKLPEDEEFPLTDAGRPSGINGNYFDYGASSLAEIQLHNGQFLHNIGLRGQGLQIAMLDAGFRNYTTLRAFDSVNNNNRILSTWDFVAREASVVEDHQHGMQCLSTIAANIPGEFVGKAPEASFHLFRTEDVASEYPIEEFNWVCAAERADSIGADVISSSLGYGYDWSSPVADYPYSDLNGDITMAARGADLAAAKGLLVFNSAGNSGNNYWKMITTPADGDSVVAVGAVNSNGVIGSFSSYGPSADGRIKPDLASVGVAALIQSTANVVVMSNGTSYACPKLAGLATCLWQGFPEYNNMRIVQALKESGDRYTNPDDRTGYGIPDMKKAFGNLLREYSSASVTVQNCNAVFNWTSKDTRSMRYVLERKMAHETSFSTIHIWDAEGGAVLGSRQYEKILSLDSTEAGEIQYQLIQVIDSTRSAVDSIMIGSLQVQLFASCPAIVVDHFRLMPNPPASSSQLSFMGETPDAISELLIQMYTSTGQLVYQSRMSKPAGRTFITTTTPHRVPGIYIIRITDHNRQLAVMKLFQF